MKKLIKKKRTEATDKPSEFRRRWFAIFNAVMARK